MAQAVAQWIVYALAAYVAVGVVIGLPFAWRGVRTVDPSAREGSIGFRLLIIPGCVALWPFVLRRWRTATGATPTECNAHRQAAARTRAP